MTMKIAYLADHKDLIPTLARWSYEEWSYIHSERTVSDIEQLMVERSNKTKMPLCLVALDRESVRGMAALKINDLPSLPDLSPWLASLYVDKEYRNKGTGTKLVRAIEQRAAVMGVKKLYLYTLDTEKFYLRLNWLILERTEWKGYPVTVMEKEIVI